MDSDLSLKDDLEKGFEFLLVRSRNIAVLPLEEWKEALNRAENLGMILDPTLYREYISSRKPEILKSIINAAIPLKHAVMNAQSEIHKSLSKLKR